MKPSHKVAQQVLSWCSGPKYITSAELANYTAKNVRTIQKYVAETAIPYYRIERTSTRSQILFKLDEVEAYLNHQVFYPEPPVVKVPGVEVKLVDLAGEKILTPDQIREVYGLDHNVLKDLILKKGIQPRHKARAFAKRRFEAAAIEAAILSCKAQRTVIPGAQPKEAATA